MADLDLQGNLVHPEERVIPVVMGYRDPKVNQEHQERLDYQASRDRRVCQAHQGSEEMMDSLECLVTEVLMVSLERVVY